jgi:hypothetical protein
VSLLSHRICVALASEEYALFKMRKGHHHLYVLAILYCFLLQRNLIQYVSAFSLCHNDAFNHTSQDGLLCTIRSWLSFFPSSTTVVTSLVFMIPFDFQLGPLRLPNSYALPEEFSWVLNMDLMLKSWRREDRLPDTSPRLNSRFIQINEMAAESVYES